MASRLRPACGPLPYSRINEFCSRARATLGLQKKPISIKDSRRNSLHWICRLSRPTSLRLRNKGNSVVHRLQIQDSGQFDTPGLRNNPMHSRTLAEADFTQETQGRKIEASQKVDTMFIFLGARNKIDSLMQYVAALQAGFENDESLIETTTSLCRHARLIKSTVTSLSC